MKRQLTEDEMDDLVIAQADDDTAWEGSILAQRERSLALTLPADLAKRVEFLAKLHRATNPQAWLMRVIEERIELEEGAFLQAKRELAAV